MPYASPYHVGELSVQSEAGQASLAQAHGRGISDHLVSGAWSFLWSRQMAVLGSWDGARGVWPSLMFGSPGFMNTFDGRQVQFDTALASRDEADPLWANIRASGYLSLLAIDLSARRRRLRVNGRVDRSALTADRCGAFVMAVEQAYGNCPKYIQRRNLYVASLEQPSRFCSRGTALSNEQVDLIEKSDTLFVATVHPDYGTDVSHRGGKPGFVRIVESDRLLIPDYAGNSMFNTLGNIAVSGLAGIAFVDFESNRQLQVIGDAKIDRHAESGNVERTWTLVVREVRESTPASAVQWTYVDAWPFNP